MDRLNEQKNNFAAFQLESSAAIADREKVMERLKTELKSLGARLESVMKEVVTLKRQAMEKEVEVRDAKVVAEVRMFPSEPVHVHGTTTVLYLEDLSFDVI
jgi:archaellum component FlaC